METDTNIFQVSMACLKNNAELATGDPEFCKTCNAVFNSESVIKKNLVMGKDPEQIWQCEFCNTENKVCFEDEELPKHSEINYLLEAPA